MKSVQETISRISFALSDDARIREAAVLGAWVGAIGESLGKHTKPLRYDNEKLVVAVRDLSWKRHLESLASQIVFKINSKLRIPAVKFIEFHEDRFGRHFVDDSRKKHIQCQRRKMAYDEIIGELREAIDLIPDGELRERISLAAGGCLSRKKRLKL